MKNKKDKVETSLKKNIISGVKWNTLETIVNNGFSFLVKIILTKMILPEDLGIVGMAVVFTGLVEVINELGLGASLIQKKKDDLQECHYDTAFFISIIINITSFLLMIFVISPIAVRFYNEQRLNNIIIALSLPLLVKSIVIVQKAKLRRNFKFRILSSIEIASSIFAGITAIVMVLLGFGVWSLIFQSIVRVLIYMALLIFHDPALPKLKFTHTAFKGIFSFGIFVLLKDVLVFFVGNVDYLIIGRVMDSYALGLYTFAFMWTDMVRKQMMSVMNKVMFPVYSKVQNDVELLQKCYLKVIKYNSIVIFPIMIIMLIYTEDIIKIIFGVKWIEAALPLKILCVSTMIHIMSGGFAVVMTGIGKAKEDFVLYLVKTFIVTIPLLLIFINNYGIVGAACASLISKIISVCINQTVMSHYKIVKGLDMLKEIFPSLIAILPIIALSLILNIYIYTFDNIIILIIKLIVLSVIYLFMTIMLNKNEAMFVWKMLISMSKKKS